MQAGLGALEHLGEPVTPGVGQPRAAGRGGVGGAVAVADGQLDVALQPPQVRHLADVAEVRLAGVGHRGDDLVAALGDGLGVTGHLVEQPAAARSGVVDLVDVGAELAAAGSHAALRFSGADPVVGAAGLDQHPLDGGRGRRLQCRHRGGADEDAVDRHQREAVVLGPTAGQVLGRPLGGADAAADAHGDVRPRAQLGVGGQQEVVEVLPGVVSAGAAALDVHDDRLGRHLCGDPDDRTDLLDGAWLEHDVADADLVELLDQRDGLLQLGDARTDHDAVDRRTGLARLLHQPLAADLELPQVRVEEQRVELDGAARLEQLGQLGDAAVEDLFGDLPAACELGPVARRLRRPRRSWRRRWSGSCPRAGSATARSAG